MSLNDMIAKKTYKPPVIVIYGEAGAGKTTLGATFPAPVFLNLEGSGLRAYDVPEIPIKSIANYRAAVTALKTEPNEFQTVVVDTIDKLEEMAGMEICRCYGVDDLINAAGGYGKGYKERAELVNGLVDATIATGKVPVFLAHSYVETRSSPDVASDYQYRDLKLWKSRTGGIDIYNHLIDLSDMVGYITTELVTKENRAMTKGGRKVLVEYSPAHQSKIRVLNAPKDIECDGKKILAVLDGGKPPVTVITGKE